MLVRFLLVTLVAISSLALLKAPVREGVGGFLGKGLLRAPIGELGAAGASIEGLLQDQFLGKRVHYTEGKHSWSGKVSEIKVLPFSEHTDEPRAIEVTVETTAGMGDPITPWAQPRHPIKGAAGMSDPITTRQEQQRREEDYGSQATISLDQISGIMQEAHPQVGSSIKVDHSPGEDGIQIAFPMDIPGSPSVMFVRGYPNTIVAYYSDGYFEVDVNESVETNSEHTSSGTIFIHAEDILNDPRLEIVTSSDAESDD